MDEFLFPKQQDSQANKRQDKINEELAYYKKLETLEKIRSDLLAEIEPLINKVKKDIFENKIREYDHLVNKILHRYLDSLLPKFKEGCKIVSSKESYKVRWYIYRVHPAVYEDLYPLEIDTLEPNVGSILNSIGSIFNSLVYEILIADFNKAVTGTPRGKYLKEKKYTTVEIMISFSNSNINNYSLKSLLPYSYSPNESLHEIEKKIEYLRDYVRNLDTQYYPIYNEINKYAPLCMSIVYGNGEDWETKGPIENIKLLQKYLSEKLKVKVELDGGMPGYSFNEPDSRVYDDPI